MSQNHNIQTLINIIDKHKVAAIGVASDDAKFIYYKGGILDECGDSYGIDHAVVAVGYVIDHERGRYYWIVKNSWGRRWGN